MGGLLGGEVPVDLGGQWLGAGHARLEALAQRVGVGTFPTWHEGRNVLLLDGRRRTYRGTIPRLGPLVLADLGLARWRFDRESRRPPQDADQRTLADWLRAHVRTQPARSLMRVAGLTVWGAEPDEMSLLHVLRYAGAANGIDSLVDVEGGAQETRLEPNAHALAARLADGLDVRLSEPVTALEHESGAVVATTRTGSVRAESAIVAVPPPLREPLGLPAVPMTPGTLTKVQLLYDRPFWRDDGLSGAAVIDRGPVTLTFDSSPRDGGAGVLTCFVGGEDARVFARRDPGERRAAVVRQVGELFGGPAPADHAEQQWGLEPGGAPTQNFGPGGWTAHGEKLRAPLGRIHFAGTETATHWPGYMEGALQSAERVVAELESL
jgi:monoamine oxidase